MINEKLVWRINIFAKLINPRQGGNQKYEK